MSPLWGKHWFVWSWWFSPPSIKLPRHIKQCVLCWGYKKHTCRSCPVPLTAFRSNSKFDQNLECCSLNMLNLSHRKSAHVTIVTLSWRVQNYVAIGGANFKPEHFKFWCHFEFDRNIVSGTGAWTMGYLLWVFVKKIPLDIGTTL